MKLVLNILRYAVGALFVFSGFVKSIDPIGFSYKVEEYFLILFNSTTSSGFNLTVSIIACVLELAVGLILMGNFRFRIFVWFAFGFMLIFTPLTYYLAVTDALHDCGCFGDFIQLSNWETFYKNLIISIPVLILVYYRTKIQTYTSTVQQDIWISSSIVLSLAFCIMSVTRLPIIDFRSYKVGTDLRIEKFYYRFADLQTGKEVVIAEKDTEAMFSRTDWEFQNEIGVNMEDKEVPIFQYYDTNEMDITPDLILDSILWIVSPQIADFSVKKIKLIAELSKKTKQGKIKAAIITGSQKEDVKAFQEKYNLSFPFYFGDDTQLKEVVRSNPGFVMVEDGIITAKYHYNSLPEIQMLFPNIE